MTKKEARKKYKALVDAANRRKWEPRFSEKHHIVPKFAGGGNGKSNLVRLTPRRHYDAHRLLVVIYAGTKYERGAVFSLWRMTTATKRRGGGVIRLAKSEYSTAREKMSKTSKPYLHLTEDSWKTIARHNRRRLKGKPAHNRGKKTPKETRLLISERTKQGMDSPEVKKLLRQPKSKKHCEALSLAAKNRKKRRCSGCRRLIDPSLFNRWGHGAKCKGRK